MHPQHMPPNPSSVWCTSTATPTSLSATPTDPLTSYHTATVYGLLCLNALATTSSSRRNTNAELLGHCPGLCIVSTIRRACSWLASMQRCLHGHYKRCADRSAQQQSYRLLTMMRYAHMRSYCVRTTTTCVHCEHLVCCTCSLTLLAQYVPHSRVGR
eukprot:5025-Heterococcus_DN1.PRE.4